MIPSGFATGAKATERRLFLFLRRLSPLRHLHLGLHRCWLVPLNQRCQLSRRAEKPPLK